MPATKQCFVVCAIGSVDSEQRHHADWVFEEIIQPVFEKSHPDFGVLRSDKISMPGTIDAQTIDKLLNAELVIADITFLNPNAFYEIGIRHVVAKPIVHMHKKGEKIPFDIGAFRSLDFDYQQPSSLRAARSGLSDLVSAAISPDHRVDSPVTKARGIVNFESIASSADVIVRDELSVLSGRLQAVESRLDLDAELPLFARDVYRKSFVRIGRSPPRSERSTIEVSSKNGSASAKILHEFIEENLTDFAWAIVENNGNNLVVDVIGELDFDRFIELAENSDRLGVSIRKL